VILCRQAERRGKTVAQRLAVRKASGDILVFFGCHNPLRAKSLRHILGSFADSQVGCVSGQLVYSPGAAMAEAQGCRTYWHYEKVLQLEASSDRSLGSAVASTQGGVAAVHSLLMMLSKILAWPFEIRLKGLSL
jgi:hypothetical protein